jgi:hypothetical protein
MVEDGVPYAIEPPTVDSYLAFDTGTGMPYWEPLP